MLSEVRATVSELRIKKDSSLGEALETLTQGLPNLSVQLVIDLDEELIELMDSEDAKSVLSQNAKKLFDNNFHIDKVSEQLKTILKTLN